jgi:hypothetical protein
MTVFRLAFDAVIYIDVDAETPGEAMTRVMRMVDRTKDTPVEVDTHGRVGALWIDPKTLPFVNGITKDARSG